MSIPNSLPPITVCLSQMQSWLHLYSQSNIWSSSQIPPLWFNQSRSCGVSCTHIILAVFVSLALTIPLSSFCRANSSWQTELKQLPQSFPDYPLLWGRLTLPLPKLSWDIVLWIHVSPWDTCCLHLPYHSQAQQLEYLLLCKYRHRAVDPWILIKLNCLIWFSWNLSQVSISFPLKKNFSWLYWVFIAVHVFL